jgi:hypothetical protein
MVEPHAESYGRVVDDGEGVAVFGFARLDGATGEPDGAVFPVASAGGRRPPSSVALLGGATAVPAGAVRPAGSVGGAFCAIKGNGAVMAASQPQAAKMRLRRFILSLPLNQELQVGPARRDCDGRGCTQRLRNAKTQTTPPCGTSWR